LKLARTVLERHVRGASAGPEAEHPLIGYVSGAFVSVHREGELRACLGRIESTLPLPLVIVELARAVADSDPRFEPLARHELDELDIEISVLTPHREIATPDDIVVGVHGLIVEQGFRRGLLLPQVAREHGWSRETFLAHACLKAGLSRGAWHSGARIFVFEAEVFGEKQTGRVRPDPTAP
jgi:AmmeMemoRadiSam system protein A